jgi:hypothetical protein
VAGAVEEVFVLLQGLSGPVLARLHATGEQIWAVFAGLGDGAPGSGRRLTAPTASLAGALPAPQPAAFLRLQAWP